MLRIFDLVKPCNLFTRDALTMIQRLFLILATATLLLIFSASSLTTADAWAGEKDVSSGAASQSEQSSGGKVDPIILLTIFVLAVFVGFEIITKIPPTLHTPLMSGSNAISGITLVGAILCGTSDHEFLTVTLGFLAVVFASLNAVGGFLVTHRMLSMFRRKS